MLYAERDAYYCQTAQKAESDVKHGYFDASEKYPDDVHQEGQASVAVNAGIFVTPERPEGQVSHLEQLESERDSDYRDAEQQSHYGIIEADHKSSHDQP